MTETEHVINPAGVKLTLRKSAKLRHRTLVSNLFERGKSVYAGPLRLTFRALSEEELASSFKGVTPDRIGPVQMMITVPKKKRKHAVDRVLMRRRIREAFRLRYRPLRQLIECNPDIRTLSIAIVYLEAFNSDTPSIHHAMERALAKLTRKL